MIHFLYRNLIPDNLFQATFQQIYTVLISQPHPSNLTSTPNTSAISHLMAEPEITRELHHRSGTNTLGLVFFCMMFGMFLGTIGPKGKVITDVFSALFEVVMKIVTLGILWLSPLGISSIIAGRILSIQNVDAVLSQLMWFMLTVLFGIFAYQWIGTQLIYFLFIGKNPFKFYVGLLQPILTATATSSR